MNGIRTSIRGRAVGAAVASLATLVAWAAGGAEAPATAEVPATTGAPPPVAAAAAPPAAAAPRVLPPPAPLPPDAVMEMDERLPEHTVYRPADLATRKGRLPIVAFGNGGCMHVGNAFAPFLGAVAARGYLVAAPGPIDPAFGTGPRPPRDAAPKQNRTEQMFATIDWAIAENGRKDSPYYRKIDTKKIAVMGQSCGGLQAIAAGADPRVTTVLVLNSGIIRGSIRNPDGTTRMPAYLPATEADLPKLHSPMLYLSGGATDQAQPGAEGDVAAIEKLPVFHGALPVGHGGTWREVGGGAMGAAAIAWLDWHLKGDRAAAKTFVGERCGLCTDSRWTVRQKHLR